MQPHSESWLSRSDWQNGQIKPRHVKLPFIITLVFFVFWTGIALLVNHENKFRIERAFNQFIDSGFQNTDAQLLLPLMFLLSLLMIPSLIKTWRRYRVSSHIRLHLSPYPGQVGGKVAGNILLPIEFRHGMPADVRINCIEVSRSKSSSSSSRWENVRWRTRADVQLMPLSGQTQIRFTANIDKDLSESSIEESGSYVYWAVRIHMPENKFDETFNIPVFASSDSIAADYYETPSPSKPADLTGLSPEVAVIEQGVQGSSVSYPAGREKTIARVFIIMAIIFDLVAVFMGYQVFTELSSERTSYFAVMVSGMIFLGFSVFGIGMLFGGIYMLTNTLRVDINRTGVTATRQVFGREYVTHLLNENIRGMMKKVTSQAGQGASAKINYSIYLLTKDGRRVSIGDGISGHENADKLHDYFESHIHMGATSDAVASKRKLPMPEWAKYLLAGVKMLAGLAFFGTIAAFIYDFIAM